MRRRRRRRRRVIIAGHITAKCIHQLLWSKRRCKSDNVRTEEWEKTLVTSKSSSDGSRAMALLYTSQPPFPVLCLHQPYNPG